MTHLHLDSYLNRMAENNAPARHKINEVANDFSAKHLEAFDFASQKIGLLLGNVQSGKTGQVFGIIAKAADEGFEIFILLTTDNVHLHKQTFERALQSLDTFNIYSEDDETRFQAQRLRKPILLILKKNYRILKRWLDNLSASGFCRSKPIFVVDDEGDAASLNTKINKGEQSTISGYLTALREIAPSSIYLQVTATPQSLLLQQQEGWAPSFCYYFAPSNGYSGGNFFYTSDDKGNPSYPIILTGEDELTQILENAAMIPKGLEHAIYSFLITSSHLLMNHERDVCNFLIHPSFKISDHRHFAKRVREYLNLIKQAFNEEDNATKDKLKLAYDDLKNSKPDISVFDKITEYISSLMENDEIQIIILNSEGSVDFDHKRGANIIIGGNSLGRGVTFSSLHTVYYCRKAKKPQADTFWQHSRIFGYDRDRGLVRMFLPASLYQLFNQLNQANNQIINIINDHENALSDVKMCYPSNVNPTRPCVLDKDLLNFIVGGVNYFPFYPVQTNKADIDNILDVLGDAPEKSNFLETDLDLLIEIIKFLNVTVDESFYPKAFIQCLELLKHNNPTEKGVLIVRKSRRIKMGTGTLLSPNDRQLGATFYTRVVLTIYELTGDEERGWDGRPFWIGNIKFPKGFVFWRNGA